MEKSQSGRTILIGEDEPEVLGYFELALKCLGYSVELAQDGDEVLSCLKSARSEISAVLLDLIMPNRDGLETLRDIREMNPDIPVIVVSGAASTLKAVTVMKCGATDFLCKPVGHEDLQKALLMALEKADAVRTISSGNPGSVTKAFLGTNPRMKEIQVLIRQIGWSEVPVLIQGETGTGKEVLARELHEQSPRASGPFLKLNCAALPSELVESELFGYERGAFTGALQKKAGMFEMADRGTILLDEIGDMDVRLQAKLLQVLQDQEFRRIGGKETVKVDVRVIAATHRDLEKAIFEQTFREDLYYRLSVINLHVPPLRDRREDIVALAEFLITKYSKKGVPSPTLTLDLKDAMTTYTWPGNVRELENCIRRLTILRNADAIARELRDRASRKPFIAATVTENHSPAPRESSDGSSVLLQVTKAKQQAETSAILAALNATRWNRKQAAALLVIDYKALLYKMKKLGIEDQPTSIAPTQNTAVSAN
jgi:two-component system, NtrC family, response regulator AtoC